MRDPAHALSARLRRVSNDPRRVLTWASWRTAKARKLVNQEFFVDRSREVAETLFVVGSARSGTTWLAEVLSADPQTRFIMEPFDERNSQFRGGLPDATFLQPGTVNERLTYFCERVFTGALRSQWTDQFNHAHHPTRRVVKDVRTVALLPWIHAAYPQMPTIYILRHPFATAWSMSTLGWGTHGDLLNPTERIDNVEMPEKELLSQQAFIAEVTRWCVETSRALSVPMDDVHVVFYESLVQDPEFEFGRIATFLEHSGPAWRSWRPDPEAIVRPSKTSVRRSPGSDATAWIETWQGRIDPATLNEAERIVKAFGLDDLYAMSPTPQCAPDAVWRKSEGQ